MRAAFVIPRGAVAPVAEAGASAARSGDWASIRLCIGGVQEIPGWPLTRIRLDDELEITVFDRIAAVALAAALRRAADQLEQKAAALR